MTLYVSDYAGLLRCCVTNPGPTRGDSNYMNTWEEFDLARVLDHQKLTDDYSWKPVIAQGCVYKGKVRAVILEQLRTSYPYMARMLRYRRLIMVPTPSLASYLIPEGKCQLHQPSPCREVLSSK